MDFFIESEIADTDSDYGTAEKKYTLLLVDDEAANLRFLEGLLEEDYNILTATNGHDALELLLKDPEPQRISLIITDQRMPKMTGVEFLKETINIIPNSIRMILTGFSDIEAIIKAINEGKVYKYLTKPLEPKDLQITVKRALETYELELENHSLINELKQFNSSLEQKVEERTKKLTELNEALQEMTEMIVHDLKNPISNVLMFSDHIIAEELSRERYKDVAALIKTSGVKLFKMVESLLDISSIEQGNIELKIKNINAIKIVGQIIGEFRAMAEAKNISLIFQGTSEEIEVNADPDRLHQVLENLVSNAVKFSQPGKNVIITLNRQNDGPSGNDILFMVRDHGPGLTNEDKNRLFRKFARLSATPTGGEHSSRVGLSIVKSMVEAMNGNIWCESEPGEGAAFYFTLPV
jgi:two-component system sensor histidine kinase/response regulator